METTIKRPVVNPSIVLREEFDDWALLYDPDSGEAYGLNPIGVTIWKHLDGGHEVDDLVGVITGQFDHVPEDVKAHIEEFLDSIIKRGLAGSKLDQVVH
jgi:SynChlorMet cassette protein ScmD